jgi:carboxyl-terminal processing protease
MYLRQNKKYTDETGKDNDSVRKNNKRTLIILVAVVFVVTNIISLYAGSYIALPLGSKVMVSTEDYSRLQDVKSMMASNNDLSKAFEGYSGVLKFKKLFDVKELLSRYYYGDINEDILVEGAIKGMTSALNDPYTVFMNPKEFQDFSTQTEGAYVGLGIQVGVKNDRITVIAPFDDSPAEKAGILPGDAIIRVNGKEVTGKDMELAVSMMKGKKGETVNLSMYRENKGVFDLSVKRAEIIMVTVKGEMLDNKLGYIQLSMFDEHTGKDFNKKLSELKAKGMKGLILDLRDNPGGLLTSCIDVTSNFVEQNKVITSTKDKYNNEKPYNSKGGLAIGMPLVVLINEGTASASEILSGTVRDYKLGSLVGTTTFGKGVVQTILDIKDGTALKVTISKYFTPNGENIHKVGIKPDVEVKYPAELREKTYSRSSDPQFNKALELIKEKVK